MYRRLVALLCDDYAEALAILSHIIPRVLVTRHLHRSDAPRPQPPVSVMLAALAQESPAERARIKYLNKPERERYVRAVRHRPELPRGNWHALWKALSEACIEPELIWRPEMAEELQQACAQEVADLDLERRNSEMLGRDGRAWDHRHFR